MKKILPVIVIAFSILALFGAIRGIYGNPNVTNLNKLLWRDNGPFELSPERGRFALLYSLIENHSFYFSVPLARFVLPDLGYKDGHYVSLFAPAVSYIAMPGYLVGKYFGASQVGAFSTSAFFGLINLLLIFLIVKNITKNSVAGLFAGFVFLFATPAFAYAVNLYQHHISTFLILMSLYLLIKYDNFWSNALIFLLCAMSIPVDYPNLFLMTPIGIAAFLRAFNFEKLQETIALKLNLPKILAVCSVVFPLMFFMWFNKMSYGNPLQFSGTVEGVRAIDDKGLPANTKKIDPQNVENFIKPEDQKKSAVAFFKPRNILNGMYIHILSPDRGMIYYTPVILLGILGIYFLHKAKNKYLAVLLGVIGFNIFLYSMWGDPWGGWAFGSRYMIPAYSILAILLGVTLSKIGKKWWFIIPFWILLVYSLGVNTLGAITTSSVPPQAEALPLEAISGKRERYSYDRNWEFLTNTGTKSFTYNSLFYKYISPLNYFYILIGSIAGFGTAITVFLLLNKNENNS